MLSFVMLLLALCVTLPLSLGAQEPTVAQKLDRLLEKTVDGKKINGVVVHIMSGDGRIDYRGSAGALTTDTSYFIASATKLFVTSIVMQLRAEGRLGLDDKLTRHLPAEELAGLHVYRGVDRSGEITIRQLLSHTSGVPDYFEGERDNGVRLDRELLAGRDQSWDYADALDWARGMSPRFAPGASGKAHYSDTNFQLLGRLIEHLEGRTIDPVIEARILTPLGLTRTYMYRDTTDRRPAATTGSSGVLHIPRAMASFGPDGGVVSTADEQVTFLRAFFGGQLFPAEYLQEMEAWNRIFFPLQYGVGVMRFRLPRWMSPFSAPPDLRGHSGLSGSFMFYDPERDLYIAGTVNSVASQSAPYRLMLRRLAEVKHQRVQAETAPDAPRSE